MKIVVPEKISSELRKLEGIAEAQIESVFLGQSKSKNPKATIKYVITDDMDGIPDGEPSTIGEPVLENYSLLPQSMWKINDTYKQVKGERIPQGDFTNEEFEEILVETLVGSNWTLVLELEIPDDGSSTEPRTVVTDKTYKG